MVKEISSISEFDSAISAPQLSVVDFHATWCGPCKAIAPEITRMAGTHTDVNFYKVDVDELKDLAAREGVTAMPTFKLYISGQVVYELKGANAAELERNIILHKAGATSKSFGGKASFAGGSADAAPTVLSKAELAAARAARFASTSSSSGTSSSGGSSMSSAVLAAAQREEDGSTAMNGDDGDEALAKAVAMSLQEAASSSSSSSSSSLSSSSSSGKVSAADQEKQDKQDAADEAEAKAEIAAMQEWEEEMVPLPVDEQLLQQLMDMGFPDARSRKAIHHGNTLDGAVAWLGEHENDPEIDQPYMVRKADTLPKKELTPEEKAEKLKKMTDLIKQRRAEREKAEKIEEIKREKERRERGQKMDDTAEKREAMQRKRENERIKKEKDDVKKEREKIKAELERDRELRRLNKGVLPSVLGIDGYAPSAVQYDKVDAKASAKDGPAAGGPDVKAEAKAAPKSSSGAKSSAPVADPEKVIDGAIETVMRYRAGGDGGNALKLLLLFIKNIVDNPTEAKYRSINTESAAWKSKAAPFVGPAALLKALGFEKSDDGKLVLPPDNNAALLAATSAKLTQAVATYATMNP